MDVYDSSRRETTNIESRNSRSARLSSHLPNIGLRVSIAEGHRISQSSSVYDDDEWNRQLARFSHHSDHNASRDRDSLYISIAANHVNHAFEDDGSQVNGHDLNGLEKGLAESSHSLEISRDLKSRNLCVSALALGLIAGVASLAAGCQIVAAGKVLLPDWLRGTFMNMGEINYPFPAQTAIHYLSGHRIFPVAKAAMLTINLLLNICLTALFDCMAFIHNTTLRWSLCKEGRLVYNSNPRLFTGARKFAPNWRITNAVCGLAIFIGYGSISVLTTSIYIVGMVDAKGNLDPDAPITAPRYAVDFSGWGFIGLGIALLLQGSVSSWCLFKSKIVPTWSSNPFNTALVCDILGFAQKNKISHQEALMDYKPMLSSSLPEQLGRKPTESTSAGSSKSGYDLLLTLPQSNQPAMKDEVPRSRRFVYFIWIIFALIVLWILLNTTFAMQAGSCSNAFVEDKESRTDFIAYWSSYCRVSVPYYKSPFFDRRDWVGLILQSTAFCFITLALHCGELLANITRDEAAWRKATTAGADAGRGALIEGATSWECWLIFAFKAATPWMFGLAFETNLLVMSNLLPLATLGFMMLLLALFSEYLIRRKPKGPQPCTFGNIAKLIDLVDEWHPRIFWGDKGMVDHKIRKAGTAGQRLADLDTSMLYMNLRV